MLVILKPAARSNLRPLLPRQQLPATASGIDPGLDTLELRYTTRNRDPTRMIKPVFLLRLPQQIPKQRVIEIYHRHKDPFVIAVLLAHVHRQLPPRRRRGLVQRHVAPTSPVSGGAEGFDCFLKAGEERGHGFGLGCRWRVEPVVPGWDAVYPGYVPEKCGESGDPVLEPESSDPKFHESWWRGARRLTSNYHPQMDGGIGTRIR